MPHRLNTSAVPEYRCFAELPHYYVMLKSQNMAQGVADAMPTPAEVRTLSSRWLPEQELAVFVEEFGRTGFQGGLNWYRGGHNSAAEAGLGPMAGAHLVEVPALFIGGKSDWGVWQMRKCAGPPFRLAQKSERIALHSGGV